MSHAGGLRDHWTDDDATFLDLVRGLIAFGERVPELSPRAAIDAFESVALPGLDATDVAIVRFVALVTLLPRAATKQAVTSLRDAGLDDLAVHDVVQVACCFSYMNRLADGLGVGVESRKRAAAVELYGEEATAAHESWSTRP